MAVPIIARVKNALERMEVTEAAAAAILSSPYSTRTTALWAQSGLALLAVLRKDEQAAAERYSALESATGAMLSGGSSVTISRLLGLLSQVMGNLDQAAAHFEDALEFCRNAGYRPELAWTCCDYADTLRELNNVGDREQAISLLDESLAISTELGMRPLMERVISRRDGLLA